MAQPQHIKVLVADDTPIGRAGMSTLLEEVPGISIVGHATTAQEVLLLVREYTPDVLLLDLNWFDDESAGESAIKQIKAERMQVRIIAITAFKHLIDGARRAGAEAGLNKNVSKSELLSTIRAVYKSPFPAAETVMQAEKLTERERQVLEIMAQGKTAKQIARGLNIEEATVRHHMTSLREKLGAANNTQAVGIAFERRLLPGKNAATPE